MGNGFVKQLGKCALFIKYSFDFYIRKFCIYCLDNLDIFDIIPVFGGSKTLGALFTVFLLLMGQFPLKYIEKKGHEN